MKEKKNYLFEVIQRIAHEMALDMAQEEQLEKEFQLLGFDVEPSTQSRDEGIAYRSRVGRSAYRTH